MVSEFLCTEINLSSNSISPQLFPGTLICATLSCLLTSTTHNSKTISCSPYKCSLFSSLLTSLTHIFGPLI